MRSGHRQGRRARPRANDDCDHQPMTASGWAPQLRGASRRVPPQRVDSDGMDEIMPALAH